MKRFAFRCKNIPNVTDNPEKKLKFDLWVLEKMSIVQSKGYIILNKDVYWFENSKDGYRELVIMAKEIGRRGKIRCKKYKKVLSEIRRHLHAAEMIYDTFINNPTKDMIWEMHNENFTLGHCLRWGRHAIEDVFESGLPENI